MVSPRFSTPLTRRTVLTAGSAALLAACTSDSASSPATTVITPSSSSSPAPTTVAGAGASRSIRVLLPPESIVDSVLERIATSLDASIILEAYADPAFVFDRLFAQQGTYQYDVVVVPGAFLPAAITAGLLRPIDATKVPALAGQLDQVKASPFDPESRYSVCKEVGYTGYAWDRNVLPDGISSWQAFVDAAARPDVSGKVTCLAEGADCSPSPRGPKRAAPVPTSTSTRIEGITEQLGPHLLDLDSGASVRMAEGTVVLAQMWNGEGRRLVASDPDRWGYAIGGPVTGVWMERFVIPAAAPNADLAEAFIDAMLQPELSLEQATARGYNTGVAAVQADLAALDGVAIPTGDDMFGDSKDYGESLLDASAEDLRAVVVGTITSLAGASGTPTSTTDPAQSTTTAPTETTASAPETTAAAVTSTTAQLDQKGRRVLRPSDEGPEVKDLQQRLKALGFSLGLPDGQYGDLHHGRSARVPAFTRPPDRRRGGHLHVGRAREPEAHSQPRREHQRRLADGEERLERAFVDGRSERRRTWVKAVIYLDSFRDEFFDANGKLVGSFPNSPGVNGLTPTGTFRVYSRSANTFFSRNPAETMKWMVRFNGGVGFHNIPRIDGVPQPTPLGQGPAATVASVMPTTWRSASTQNLPDNAVVIVQHG